MRDSVDTVSSVSANRRFWDIDIDDERSLIIQYGKDPLTYPELQCHIDEIKKLLANGRKKLGFIFARNSYPSLIGYLASLQSGDAVGLLSPELDGSLITRILDLYKPDWIWSPSCCSAPDNYQCVHRQMEYNLYFLKRNIPEINIHPDLALLLTTSGSTGNPKLVRLSYKNIQSNAASIAEYLQIGRDEHPITTLPMQYTYGLSVIHSHLYVNSSLLLTDHPLTSEKFWQFFKDFDATSIAGVPYTYQMLHRLKFHTLDLPSLKMMTQAGGHLDVKLQKYFSDLSRVKKIKYFTMYGQTEATARISYVPCDRIDEGIGSIGVPIPGGRLELEDDQELVYYGPNVMMGYATGRDDLVKGDELQGRLLTGDIAEKKKDFFYIIGRKKRFVKLFGLRINLDDIEKLIFDKLSVESVCTGNDRVIGVAVKNEDSIKEIESLISTTYRFPVTALKIAKITETPRLSSGKIDYKTLATMIGFE